MLSDGLIEQIEQRLKEENIILSDIFINQRSASRFVDAVNEKIKQQGITDENMVEFFVNEIKNWKYPKL